MATMVARDLKAPRGQLVYQGPALHGCKPSLDEGTVAIWSTDMPRLDAESELWLSAHEARALANELIAACDLIESQGPN